MIGPSRCALFILAVCAVLAVAAHGDEGTTATGGQPQPEAAKAAEPQAAAPLDCEALIQKAQEKIEEGKTLLGKGLRYGDKSLQEQGQAVYDLGKQMLKDAEALSADCAKKVQELTKKDKKSGKGKSEDQGESKTKY